MPGKPANYDRLLTSINIAFVWQSPQRLAQRTIIVASGARYGMHSHVSEAQLLEVGYWG